MRAVVQRVSKASVRVAEKTVGKIDQGLVVLLGVAPEDTETQVVWLANKVMSLRLFADDQGKMNLSLLETDGEVLVISQFTLYGEVKKGRRPSFIGAAKGDVAEPLYEQLVAALRTHDVKVECGIFGALMDVELINEGPVTLVIEAPASI